MIFSSLIKKKADLTTLPETATLQEALTVLEISELATMKLVIIPGLW